MRCRKLPKYHKTQDKVSGFTVDCNRVLVSDVCILPPIVYEVDVLHVKVWDLVKIFVCPVSKNGKDRRL